MSSWPGGIPGLVVKHDDAPVRGREYCPEAERYVCCGSRRCLFCERGTVQICKSKDDRDHVLISVLKEKMLNPSWWKPSLTGHYLAFELRQAKKALDALEAQGKSRVPLRLTGERFDPVDGQRVKDLAGLPFTKEEEHELILLSILERQERERR